MRARTKRRVSYWLKAKITGVVFFFLWRAFKVLYRCDSRVKAELDSWPDGTILHMQAGPQGPHLALQRTADGPVRVKSGFDRSHVDVRFKSLDSAFLLATGQLGVAQAYAQHRFYLYGDIAITMSFVRCVDVIEGYLFPRFLTKHILKGAPVKELSTLSVYRKVIFGI
jgi:hypothetical protein